MGYLEKMLKRTALLRDRQQYIVCDNPCAKNNERLADVLEKAGARGTEFLNELFRYAARALLEPSMVGYIESNGFTVRLEVPSLV